MKVQIRHGVFETNSSSVHTLTLAKYQEGTSSVDVFKHFDDIKVIEHISKNGIYFGQYKNENEINELDVHNDVKKFLIKVNHLWYSFYQFGSYSYFDVNLIELLFGTINVIKKLGSEIDVKVDFNTDVDFLSDMWFYSINETCTVVFENTYNLARYLFNKKSLMEEENNNYYEQKNDDSVDIYTKNI